MAGTHHQHHRLAVQVLEGQALDVRAIGHPPDHQVQLADLQLRQQVGAGSGGDADHQRTVAPVQAPDHLGHHQALHRRQHADPHRLDLRLVAAQGVHPVAQGLHAGAGIAQEGHARLGQLGAGLAPFEQARAEDFLQFLEGLGDRRLRHRHGIRRLGEAALAGDFEEAGEVAELDAVVEVHGAAGAASGAGMVPNGRVGNEVWRAARSCQAVLRLPFPKGRRHWMAERLTRRAIPSLGEEGTGWSMVGQHRADPSPFRGPPRPGGRREPHLERAPTQNSTVVDTWNCRGSPIATYSRLALDG